MAEIEQRLERTHLKGEILRAQCKEWDPKENDFRIKRMEYLSDNAKDALYYVSGDKRRATSFTVWLAKRRKKVRV